MTRCGAFKRDGTRCTLQAQALKDVCWAHDPQNARERRSRASKGGRSKANKVVKELHALLEDLTQRVIDGKLETARGAVANQLISTRVRLLEYERRLREIEEFESRLERLEKVLEGREGGKESA